LSRRPRRSGGPSVARCTSVYTRRANALVVHGPDFPHPGRKKHPPSLSRRRRRDLCRPLCDRASFLTSVLRGSLRCEIWWRFNQAADTMSLRWSSMVCAPFLPPSRAKHVAEAGAIRQRGSSRALPKERNHSRSYSASRSACLRYQLSGGRVANPA